MKTLFRIAIGIAISVFLLVAGGTAALLIATDEVRKDWLTTAATFVLGRDVAVDGEFELELGSTIKLRAADIRVANADWGTHPSLLRVGTAEVQLSLAGELKPALVLDLELDEPVLLLEIGKAGVGNWEFLLPDDSGWKLPLSFSPRKVTISGGRLTFLEKDAAAPDRAEIKKLLWASEADGQFLELDGKYNDLPLLLRSKGSRSGQAPDHVSVDGRIGRLSIDGSGTLSASEVPGNPNLDLAIEFASPSLRVFDGQLGDMLPDLGPLAGHTRLFGPMLAPALLDLELALESSDSRLAMSGSIDDMFDLQGWRMGVTARTRDLTGLLAAFSLQSPVKLPPRLKVAAVLSGDWPTLALREIEGTGGDGVVTAELSGGIGDLPDLDDVDLRLQLTAPDLQSLSPYRYVDVLELPKIGPVTGSARFTATGGVWSMLDTQLEAGSGGDWVSYRSRIDDLAAGSGWDAELRARLSSLHLLGYGLPTSMQLLGAAELHGSFKDDPADHGNPALRVQATTPKLELGISGRLQDIMVAQDGAPLDLEIKGNRLADAAAAVELDLPDVGPFHFKGKFSIGGGFINIVDFQGQAGNSDLAGHLRFAMPGGGNNLVEAKLHAGTLDLTELLPRRERVELTVLQNQEIASVPEDAPAPAGKRVFSPTPLPLARLRNTRAAIEIEAERVVSRQSKLEDVTMVLELAKGVLRVPEFSAKLGGEVVESELRLDASTSPPVFEFSLHGEDLVIDHARSLVTELGLQGGTATLRVDLRGAGNSEADIMASLNGSAGLTIVGSRLIDESEHKTGEQVLKMLNPSSTGGDPNELVCAAVYFDIDQGRAKTPRGLGIQFEDVTWLGNGEIDLAREVIRISMKPLIRKGHGVDARQIAHLLLLGGTLAEPQLQIDPKGLAGMYARYVGAYLTVGLSLLIEWMQSIEKANESVCERIMPPQWEKGGGLETKPVPAPREIALPAFLDDD